MKQEYVVGFLFSLDRDRVVMIQKNKPDWQKGKLNGVGGKIEPTDYFPHFAMHREFLEETGVAIPPKDWHCFHIINYITNIAHPRDGAKIHFFVTFSEKYKLCKTMESEEVKIIDPIEIHWNRDAYIFNIPYLFHMIEAHFHAKDLKNIDPEEINTQHKIICQPIKP